MRHISLQRNAGEAVADKAAHRELSLLARRRNAMNEGWPRHYTLHELVSVDPKATTPTSHLPNVFVAVRS